MPKLNKKDRRNHFIMIGMRERATAHFTSYARKNAIIPDGVSLDEEQFAAVMDAALKLSLHSYMRGAMDALDTEDGKELEKI